MKGSAVCGDDYLIRVGAIARDSPVRSYWQIGNRKPALRKSFGNNVEVASFDVTVTHESFAPVAFALLPDVVELYVELVEHLP